MSKKTDKPLTVIGIGASAGGLQALEQLLQHSTNNQHNAYIIIQHLTPHYKSMMPEILQKQTKMKVAEIKNNMPIKPNQVYIKPADYDVIIKDHRFQLQKTIIIKGLSLPIDRFFISLANNYNENAIGIILSGTGTDGTLGIKEIKGQGGIIYVQKPSEAAYPGMPESAMQTKLVDFCLPVKNIAEKIAQHQQKPSFPIITKADDINQQLLQIHLKKILNIINEKTGHDFSNYKENTLIRRINRRIGLHQLENMEEYHRYLQDNESEINLLFKDLTIKVTSFFRNPEAFETLKTKAIIPLIKQKPKRGMIRVWVPGCDTGEEAYSIAILFKEAMNELNKHIQIQLFASDIDAESIEIARKATYPRNIIKDVTEQRLQHHFTKTETTYTLKKEIREMVVFAQQSIIKDPPFSKLDLISCRNLFIYLNNDLQKKIIPLFHYVLKNKGILFLGLSESIGEQTHLFKPLHQKMRIYQHNPEYTQPYLQQKFYHHPSTQIPPIKTPTHQPHPSDFSQILNHIILERFAPATVLIDEHYEILYFNGNTNHYLANPKGPRSFNVLEMARWGLRSKIRIGVQEAKQKQEQITFKNCQVKQNGSLKQVNLIIDPCVEHKTLQGLTLIVFEEIPNSPEIQELETIETGSDIEKKQLQQELQSTRAELQATIEELETSNEELQSVNEELQSTNEELETSREELQATNEELSTVNVELQRKVDELSKAKDYANNLLENTDTATIFLDTNYHVMRFTPQAKTIFHLRDSDIGRPLGDITTALPYETLHQHAEQVLKNLEHKELQIQDNQGKMYTIRIIPYRTSDNRITGVVITMIDITHLIDTKRINDGIVNTIDVPLLILTSDFNIYTANEKFYETFHTTSSETIDKRIYDLGNGQWNIPELRHLLEDIIPNKKTFNGYTMSHRFPHIGRQQMILNGRQIKITGNHQPLILLMIQLQKQTNGEKNGRKK